MDKFLAALSLVFLSLFLIFFVSLIPALLWYCFDDQLAAGTGVPWLGNIPFWNMYAFTLFLGFCVKTTTVNKKD
jgi:hypothetical protein